MDEQSKSLVACSHFKSGSFSPVRARRPFVFPALMPPLKVSRPSHNLNENGQAATSRGHRRDEPGLGREPRSDERLRAGQARQKPLESRGDL